MCRGQEMVHVLIEFIIVNCKEMYLTRFVGYVIISEWWKPKAMNVSLGLPCLFRCIRISFGFQCPIIFTFVSILCEIEQYSAKFFGAISDTRESDHSAETIISFQI